eukprot:GGOE01054276.1.p1 GENE.GGOE01054276.1~~GGOE01054276.1.p1  ORF type:complete len:350 (+),score=98.03 GGOE01054276.1:134-1183(+)
MEPLPSLRKVSFSESFKSSRSFGSSPRSPLDDRKKLREELFAERERVDRDVRLMKTCSLARPDVLRYGAMAEGEMHRIDRHMDHLLVENDALHDMMAISRDILEISATEYFRQAVQTRAKSRAIAPSLCYKERVAGPEDTYSQRPMLLTEYSPAIRRFTPKNMLQETERLEALPHWGNTMPLPREREERRHSPSPLSEVNIVLPSESPVHELGRAAGGMRVESSWNLPTPLPAVLSKTQKPQYTPAHRTAREFFDSRPDTKPRVARNFESEVQSFGGGEPRPSPLEVLPTAPVNYQQLLGEQRAASKASEEMERQYVQMLERHFRVQDLKLQHLDHLAALMGPLNEPGR